jgi:hypothetical protein
LSPFWFSHHPPWSDVINAFKAVKYNILGTFKPSQLILLSPLNLITLRKGDDDVTTKGESIAQSNSMSMGFANIPSRVVEFLIRRFLVFSWVRPIRKVKMLNVYLKILYY